MRLSLSSGVAPDAALPELLAACARRGITGLELVAGGGYDLSELDDGEALAVKDAASEAGIEICGLYRLSLDRSEAVVAARFAAALGAPIVVPLSGFDRTSLPRLAEAFTEAGAELLLAHGGDPRVVEAVRWILDAQPESASIGLAWEVRPGVHQARRMADVLDAAGARLRYVRLYGGGPEAQAQSGTGVGALMGRLALARFAGPMVLTPSTPSYRYAWSAWLGRAGGWGCGSKQSGETMVVLNSETHAVGVNQ